MKINELHAMRVFCKVVELGGFSRTAEFFDTSPASISYNISQLEKRFGLALLRRTTRRISLTAAGESCYDAAQEIIKQFDELEDELQCDVSGLSGCLRLETSTSLSHFCLAPAIPAFAARYPELELSISVNDRLVNPVEDRADVFIRTGAGEVDSMVSHVLFRPVFMCAASPRWLANNGIPTHPSALENVVRLGFVRSGASLPDEWCFYRSGEQYCVSPGMRFTANHAVTLCEMAANHLGLVYLLDSTLQPYIRDGRLVPVLPEWGREGPPVNILYPGFRHRNRRINAFVQFLREYFELYPISANSGPT